MALCGDCIYLQEASPKGETFCKLGNKQVSSAEEACKFLIHKEQDLFRCDRCGGWAAEPTYFQTEKDTKIICPVCTSKSGTCALCKEVYHCEFETNPSPTPKNIVESRHGQIFMSNSKNPKREQELCTTCTCWDNGCLREISGTCGKYTPWFE